MADGAETRTRTRAKVVVVNADGDRAWDFERNVWLHALDLYHPDMQTQFWQVASEKEGGANARAFWGGFPQVYARDHDALIGQCVELGGDLVIDETLWLAVLFVIGAQDFRGLAALDAGAPALSEEGKLADRALKSLLGEIDRQSRAITGAVEPARTRLWSAIAVRRAGRSPRDAESAQMLLQRYRQGSCPLNSVFCLSEGEVRDDKISGGQEFLKIRTLAEMMADCRPGERASGAWARLRPNPDMMSSDRNIFSVSLPNPPADVERASDMLRRCIVRGFKSADARGPTGPSDQPDLREIVQRIVDETGQPNLGTLENEIDQQKGESEETKAAGGGGPDQLMQRFRRDTQGGLWYKEERLRNIKRWRAELPRKLNDFRAHAEAVTSDFLRRRLDVARSDRGRVLAPLATVRLLPGARGEQQVEVPLKLLRDARDKAERRAREARADLAAAPDKLREVDQAALNHAFDGLIEAENELLRWRAFRIILWLVLPMLTFILLHNGMAALEAYLREDRPFFDIQFWGRIWSKGYAWLLFLPLIAGVLIGGVAAYTLKQRFAMERHALIGQLDRVIEETRAACRRRVEAKNAREDATLLLLAIRQLERNPEAEEDDTGARRRIVDQTLATAGGAGTVDDGGPMRGLQQECERHFTDNTLDSRRVQAFLTRHSLELKGNARFWVRHLAAAPVDVPVRGVPEIELELDRVST
ncbi:MAG: hypothetical protein AAF677_03215 [Pseudomonadota bacterium]